jgi:hypothetical protein
MDSERCGGGLDAATQPAAETEANTNSQNRQGTRNWHRAHTYTEGSSIQKIADRRITGTR